MKKTIKIEVVRDFDNTYYANINVDGDPIIDTELPEYVDARTLRKSIIKECNIEFPYISKLEFVKIGRKSFAYFSTTL